MKKNRQLKYDLVDARNIDIISNSGRMLFRQLNINISYEKVALIGRNGVGKSTLLDVLANVREPDKGVIYSTKSILLVNQELQSYDGSACDSFSNSDYMDELFLNLNLFQMNIDSELKSIGLRTFSELYYGAGFSGGELRKLNLLNAKLRNSDLLLLDEPTEALDKRGVIWLIEWLSSCNKGVIVVSHDTRLLNCFRKFWVVTESGGQYYQCSYSELKKHRDIKQLEAQKKYERKINSLNIEEFKNKQINYRRVQKINRGRLSELDRMTPRMRLNAKKGYAQESQARVAQVRHAKISQQRNYVQAYRRKLFIELPLTPNLPTQYKQSNLLFFKLRNTSLSFGNNHLFNNLNLSIYKERLAIVGPNGSGKSSLLRLLLKELEPTSGLVESHLERVGYILQSAKNWKLSESLVSYLYRQSKLITMEEVAGILTKHQFPLALAKRQLSTLSPGERTRAALIAIFAKQPSIQFLILDEPTYSLDRMAKKSIVSLLNKWHGGLLISGHDDCFLDSIGINRYIKLGSFG
ncbi:ATP-binding cassette domain-containing protein [Aliikangiella sp. IMCC44359]|uniref:ATP-binding cassette domain-containing protein n=1 Tax=Aliikangiella sp. IMCC44359 TaxID=3459125 RepID=UPI00403A84DF